MNSKLPWVAGGALGGKREVLQNGLQYLMVVRMAGRLCGPPWYDYHVVEIAVDEDGMKLHSNGWIWRWEDVQWCLPLSELPLPTP